MSSHAGVSLLWSHCDIEGRCVDNIKSVSYSSLPLIWCITQYGFLTFFSPPKVNFTLELAMKVKCLANLGT